MKLRITLMTENDKTIDADKETIEAIGKRGWQCLIDLINLQATIDGKNEIAYVEKVELVENDANPINYQEPDLDPMIIKD